MKVGPFVLAVIILVLPGILPSIADTQEDFIPSQQNLLDAADYIKNRYDHRIGLVSESEDEGIGVCGSPCNRTFWVYSDNLWASEALKPFYTELAQNISETIIPYIGGYGKSQLFEVVIGETIPTPIHDGSNVKAANYTFKDSEYTVCMDRHKPEDGGIFYDAEEYADLAFYLSLNYYLDQNTIASERWFRIGEHMWNHTTDNGFYDKAARKDGRYQNYKLGLYLFTAQVTRFSSPIYDSVETTAWSYQKKNGGIASQSYLNGTINGTANVETTSALLLAYNENLIRRVRTKPVQVGAYYYPWWNISFNNHWEEEYKGTPFLGEYNSNDSTIANKHILWAKQHKVKFFVVSWLGEGTWVDSANTSDGTWDFDEIDYYLRKGLLKAPHMQSFNFCLFYETKIILNHTVDHYKNFTEIFINDMVYAAKQYFSHPNYLRVESNPVLFIYNLPYLYENQNKTIHPIDPKDLFDLLRQRLESMNVSLYLVGEVGSGPSPFDVDPAWLYSMNATTSYLFSDVSKGWSGVLEDARVHYPDWLSEMSLKGIDFIPNAYPGFNNTGLKNIDEPTELPPNEIMFKEFLTIATNYTSNNLNMVMITSWNEWLEATAIEPSLELGELHLQTIYDVIPEFPSLTIPLLFMIATLLAVTIYKNKQKNRQQIQ